MLAANTAHNVTTNIKDRRLKRLVGICGTEVSDSLPHVYTSTAGRLHSVGSTYAAVSAL
jgi:hypothetical protein